MNSTVFLTIALFLLLGSLGLGQTTPSPVPQKDLHVYLLIGQSNMAGRAPVGPKAAAELEGCFLLNEQDEWEPAQHPLNRYSTIRKGLGMQKLNPGSSFAQTMKKAHPEATIALVVNAKGGSKIEEWAPDTRFYRELIRRARTAQESGTLKGVLWHQGESNSGKPASYLARLEDLVKNLRQDLGTPDLPFVAGQIKEGEAINEEIAKLPRTVAHTGVASSKGLKTMDRWHFDAPSMSTLGERYAAEMMRLQKIQWRRGNLDRSGQQSRQR